MEEAMRPVESVAPRIKIFKFSTLGYTRMYCTYSKTANNFVSGTQSIRNPCKLLVRCELKNKYKLW